MCISDYIQMTFFSCGRFLKKVVDDQWPSITIGSIYHIKYSYIHTIFLPWEWIDLKLDVQWKCVLYMIFVHAAFTLWQRKGNHQQLSFDICILNFFFCIGDLVNKFGVLLYSWCFFWLYMECLEYKCLANSPTDVWQRKLQTALSK